MPDTPSQCYVGNAGMIGQTLSNFRVIGEIGHGGMATVYLGEHQLIGTKAAIKVLLPMFSRDKEIVGRFFNEAKAAGRIKHPGIIEIYDFGYRDTDGTAYIIMEFVAGDSLNRRIHALGQLPIDQALVITRHVASCLSHAHDSQIIHRDLKPENIMLTPDPDVPGGERVKLLDFGIAKLLDNRQTNDGSTRAGTVLGTPAYMAPEQSGDAATVDSRADLYSVGCVFYEMLVGQPPFPGDSVGELLVAHRLKTAPPPSQMMPGIPQEIDQLIAVLLEKEPDKRIQSARDLVNRIDSIIARLGIQFGTSPGTDAPSYNYQTPTPPQRDSATAVLSDSQATVLHDSQVPRDDSGHGSHGSPRTLAGYESLGRLTQAQSRVLVSTILGLLVACAAIAGIFFYDSLASDGEETQATTAAAPTDPPTIAPTPAVIPLADAAPIKSVAIDAAAPAVAKVAIDAAPEVEPPPLVTLTVRSRPKRAKVFLGGKEVGKTPHKLKLEKGSRETVTLKLRGHRDREVELTAKKNAAKTFRLARLPRVAKPDPKKDDPKKDDPKKDDNKSVNPFD